MSQTVPIHYEVHYFVPRAHILLGNRVLFGTQTRSGLNLTADTSNMPQRFFNFHPLPFYSACLLHGCHGLVEQWLLLHYN